MVGNKKALFKNINEYCLFFKKNYSEFMPLTFHIEKANSKKFKLF